MENLGMANAYHPAGSGTQRAPQPFLPPNGYANLGQAHMAPPTPGLAPSARIIPASLLHGPYAAGYYTYTPGPQPQYQYHPAYNSTYDYNQGQFQRTPMVPGPAMLYTATASPLYPQATSFGANLTTEDNNPMSMNYHFQNNKIGDLDRSNLGPPQRRDRSHGPAGTSRSTIKGPLKPKATFMEALKSNDMILKKADKYANGLSKDDDVSKAMEQDFVSEKDLPHVDVLGSRVPEEVGETIKNEMGKHVKDVDALNEDMKKVRLNTTAGRNRDKQTMRGKHSQVEAMFLASGPKDIPNFTATYDNDGPSKPRIRSTIAARSHPNPSMFPRPYKRAGAVDKDADVKPVFFNPVEFSIDAYDAVNSGARRGCSSDNSSSAGMATPEECLVNEIEDQFFDMLNELTQLHSIWLTGPPQKRAAISAKAKEMMLVGFGARGACGDTCGKKDTPEGK